jgi:peptidoglycan biosynthesis protein MviN/MurJ (putative lipid II flippase)
LIAKTLHALLKVESYRKGIVLSTVFNILNKGLVFCNSLVIAYFFGAQLKMDIYFYAYNTIVILAAFITSLNASVLIPESMRLRAQENERKAMLFLNFFLYLYAGITLLICLLFFLNPVSAFHAVSDFPRDSLLQQAKILYLSVPLIFLMPVIGLLTDIMTSYKFFTIPMVAGIVNGIFSIVFVVLFHGILDVSSLLVGLLLAYTLNFVLLISLMKKRLGWHFGFRRLKIERRIWKNIGFAQAGNITSSLCTYAPLYLLSGFNNGIITSLNFAQQISSLPTTLVTNQFSAVAGIKFNECYAKKDFGKLNSIFLSAADFLIFILLPVSGVFFLFPTQIVSVLLEHGAFGGKGAAYTSYFLQYLGLLLPMLVINTLFARLFMASHKIRESFWYQVCFNIVLIVALYGAIRRFGFTAYPITLVAMHVLNVIGCYFIGKAYFGMIQYGRVLSKMLLLTAVNLVVGAGVYFFVRYAAIHSGFLSLAVGAGLYFSLIFVIGLLANVNDTFNAFVRDFWERGLNYYGRIKKR